MNILSKLSLIACLALAAAVPSAKAASINFPDFDVDPGGSVVVSASISPDEGQMFLYKGFQFNLSALPAGVSFDLNASSSLSGFLLDSEANGSGSRFISYTKGNAVSSTDNIVSIAFSASEAAAPGTYIINVSDVVFSSPDSEDITGTASSFTITINKLPEPPGPPTPETPQIPATPIPDGMYGNDNGTWISALKIREGNTLYMGVNDPVGGYPDAWEFIWYNPENTPIGVEQEIQTPALLWGSAANSGNKQAISENVYTVNVSNYDPDDNVFWNGTFPTAMVQVYKRPQLPTQLLRKGQHPTGGQTPETGTSCTFVIMMTPLSNQEVDDLGLTFTYGYTDRSGQMHVLDVTSKRYTHTTREIYDNTDYTFWAYSSWTYSDGSIITSGLRFLDGGEDPDFDASSITGTRSYSNAGSGIDALYADEVVLGIYSFDGRFMGTSLNSLDNGLYIVRTNNGVYKIKK